MLTMLVAFWLVTGSQSLLLAPINISRDQYETALAKWNSLHVAEYEETVNKAKALMTAAEEAVRFASAARRGQ